MGVFSGPDIRESGLVFQIDASNTKSYPGTGTTWTDVIGNRSGTISGSPTFSTNYFSMDGVNDNITFGSSVSVTAGDGFTMSMLMRFPSSQLTASAWNYFISDTAASPGRYEIGIFGQNSTIFTFKDLDSSPVTTVDSPSLGTSWKYITIGQYSNSTPFICVNGSLVSSSTVAFSNSTLDFTQLFRSSGGLKCDFAYMDLYDRELSSFEIQQNFNAIRSRFGI